MIKKPLIALAVITGATFPVSMVATNMMGGDVALVIHALFPVAGWAASGLLLRRMLSQRPSVRWDILASAALGFPALCLWSLMLWGVLNGPASLAAGLVSWSLISLAVFAVLCLFGWWRMRQRRKQAGSGAGAGGRQGVGTTQSPR